MLRSPQTKSTTMNTITFSPDMSLLYFIDNGRVIPFDLNTPNGVLVTILRGQLAVVSAPDLGEPEPPDGPDQITVQPGERPSAGSRPSRDTTANVRRVDSRLHRCRNGKVGNAIPATITVSHDRRRLTATTSGSDDTTADRTGVAPAGPLGRKPRPQEGRHLLKSGAGEHRDRNGEPAVRSREPGPLEPFLLGSVVGPEEQPSLSDQRAEVASDHDGYGQVARQQAFDDLSTRVLSSFASMHRRRSVKPGHCEIPNTSCKRGRRRSLSTRATGLRLTSPRRSVLEIPQG